MRTRDEKGNELLTPVVMTGVCGSCGAKMDQRKEGRTRQFCSPRCRVRAHRAQLRDERRRQPDGWLGPWCHRCAPDDAIRPHPAPEADCIACGDHAPWPFR